MNTAYQRLLGQVLLIVASLILLLTLPVNNLITINLAIITTTLTHRLYWEIRFKEKPNPKEWLVSFIKTTFWVSVFYLAYIIAGAMGWLGLILLSIVLAAWRIYQGKDLFNKYTSWAADRAWGRTKEGFNLMEELANGQTPSERKFENDKREGLEGQSNIGLEKPKDNADKQEHSGKGSEKVQSLYVRHSPPGESRLGSRKRKVVQKLPNDLGAGEQVRS